VASIGGLVDLKVDAIVATGGGTTLSLLKQATTTIPIIMTASPDPVAQGFAQSLARPEGNFTGMSLQSTELTGKRLQILRELVPAAQIVGIILDSTRPDLWPLAEAFARTQGWKPFPFEIRDPSEITQMFQKAADSGAGALLVPASAPLFSR